MHQEGDRKVVSTGEESFTPIQEFSTNQLSTRLARQSDPSQRTSEDTPSSHNAETLPTWYYK